MTPSGKTTSSKTTSSKTISPKTTSSKTTSSKTTSSKTTSSKTTSSKTTSTKSSPTTTGSKSSSTKTTSSKSSPTTTSTKPAPPPVGMKTVTTTSCSTTTLPPPKATCPYNLLGTNFEFPHLIVPIDSANRTKSYGNGLNGTIGGSISSVFNFDIPASAAGKWCIFRFLFPTQSQLETSAFSFSGDGRLQFATLDKPADKSSTYGNSGTVKGDLYAIAIKPGNAYQLYGSQCPAGKTVAAWLSAPGNMKLNYFQDFNPCPIGLYITVHDKRS